VRPHDYRGPRPRAQRYVDALQILRSQHLLGRFVDIRLIIFVPFLVFHHNRVGQFSPIYDSDIITSTLPNSLQGRRGHITQETLAIFQALNPGTFPFTEEARMRFHHL
jgi:hypothetical protein